MIVGENMIAKTIEIEWFYLGGKKMTNKKYEKCPSCKSINCAGIGEEEIIYMDCKTSWMHDANGSILILD